MRGDAPVVRARRPTPTPRGRTARVTRSPARRRSAGPPDVSPHFSVHVGGRGRRWSGFGARRGWGHDAAAAQAYWSCQVEVGWRESGRADRGGCRCCWRWRAIRLQIVRFEDAARQRTVVVNAGCGRHREHPGFEQGHGHERLWRLDGCLEHDVRRKGMTYGMRLLETEVIEHGPRSACPRPTR